MSDAPLSSNTLLAELDEDAADCYRAALSLPGRAAAEIRRLAARVDTQEKCITVNVREYLKLEKERDWFRQALERIASIEAIDRYGTNASLIARETLAERPAVETTEQRK